MPENMESLIHLYLQHVRWALDRIDHQLYGLTASIGHLETSLAHLQTSFAHVQVQLAEQSVRLDRVEARIERRLDLTHA
jgi:hypothetical protein